MRDISWINNLPLAEQNALLEGPALNPPLGIVSNFSDPPNLNDMGYGITIASAVLCGLLVLFRLYARAFYHKKLAIEDGLAVAALGVFAGLLYCSWRIIDEPGLYVHTWDIRMKDLPRGLYYFNLAAIIYGNVIMLLKTAILLEWVRIFVPLGWKNSFWWACHIILIVNIIAYVIFTFVEIFGCTPRQKMWRPTLPGKCLDINNINIASAIVNLVSDLIILVLPQKVIWGLKLSPRKKMGVAAVFAMGVLACTSAAFHLHSSFRWGSNHDIMYNASDLGLWCVAEIDSGFLVLCLPAMRKLFAESPWIRNIKSTLFLRSSQSGGEKINSMGPDDMDTLSFPGIDGTEASNC